MKLRSIKIETKFIPEWNGNRELTPDEQVVIHFARIPGTSEKSTYNNISFDSKGNMTMNYNDQVLLSAFVSKVENLELDIAGTPEKITNGVELSQASCSGLIDLFTEIRDYLFPSDEDLSGGE